VPEGPKEAKKDRSWFSYMTFGCSTDAAVNEGRPWASLFYWPRPRLSASSIDKLDTMVRLLFWIALIAAAFWLWRKFKVSQQSHPERSWMRR
jgi:hypothetical protein